MALIKCPECGKEISDQAKTCPNCGYKLKRHLKLNIKNRKIYINIACGAAVVVCIGGIVFYGIHYMQTQNEKRLYANVLDAQQSVIEKYGSDIEPVGATYCYRDLEANPPAEDFSYDYNTGYYVYLTYNMNPEGEEETENFLWHDGELMFDDPVSQDMFYEANTYLRNVYALESLLLLAESPQKEIQEINDKIDGSCEIDAEILKKYMNVDVESISDSYELDHTSQTSEHSDEINDNIIQISDTTYAYEFCDEQIYEEYPSGENLICGEDLDPGEYVVFGPFGDGGYSIFDREGYSATLVEEGIVTFVTLEKGQHISTHHGSVIIPKTEFDFNNLSQYGIFQAGKDIPTGEYNVYVYSDDFYNASTLFDDEPAGGGFVHYSDDLNDPLESIYLKDEKWTGVLLEDGEYIAMANLRLEKVDE